MIFVCQNAPHEKSLVTKKAFAQIEQPTIPSEMMCKNMEDCRGLPRGGGVLPIMAYTGRLCPKGVPFVRLQINKRAGISQV